MKTQELEDEGYTYRNYYWTWTTRPWKMYFGLECGARLSYLFTRKPTVRNLSMNYTPGGGYTRGFAIGVFMWYWGKEPVGEWREKK